MISECQGRGLNWLWWCLLAFLALVIAPSPFAQVPKAAAPAAAPATSPSAQALPQDPLGRATPRGTAVGFLSAAYAGNFEVAAQYLNTRATGAEAAQLAQQLFFVLDRKLTTKVANVNNDPMGSMSDPNDTRHESIGTIPTVNGKIEIYVERVTRGNQNLWLFSRQTLVDVPDIYNEVTAIAVENVLPESLLRDYLGLSLFAWLFLCVGMPLLYLLLSLLNYGLAHLISYVRRRFLHAKGPLQRFTVIAHPVRLFVVAFTIRYSLSEFGLSYIVRQVGSTAASLIVIIATMWTLILAGGYGETYFRRRLERQNKFAAATILRPVRRVIDLIVLVAGVFYGLHAFGVNPTAALTGLGVGGIAVALAAQKTLENVIGGASIIMDEAVRVGDVLKVGDIVGTVEQIGLRSTRVRTLDRTLVTIPNGQISTMMLENFAARDQYWFHHFVGLRYDTSSSTLASVLESISDHLQQDARIVPGTVRVRFLRFGASSLEFELFAYVLATDWANFLKIQEELLLQIIDIVESKNVHIAFQSHTVYVAKEPARSRGVQRDRVATAGRA